MLPNSNPKNAKFNTKHNIYIIPSIIFSCSIPIIFLIAKTKKKTVSANEIVKQLSKDILYTFNFIAILLYQKEKKSKY